MWGLCCDQGGFAKRISVRFSERSSWDFVRYGNYGIEDYNAPVNTVPAEISRGPFRKSYRNSFAKPPYYQVGFLFVGFFSSRLVTAQAKTSKSFTQAEHMTQFRCLLTWRILRLEGNFFTSSPSRRLAVWECNPQKLTSDCRFQQRRIRLSMWPTKYFILKN